MIRLLVGCVQKILEVIERRETKKGVRKVKASKCKRQGNDYLAPRNPSHYRHRRGPPVMLFAPSSVQNLHVRTDIRYLIMWQTEGRSKKKRFFCWRWHGDGDGMARDSGTRMFLRGCPQGFVPAPSKSTLAAKPPAPAPAPPPRATRVARPLAHTYLLGAFLYRVCVQQWTSTAN
jgi:hypothetical protein